MVGIEEANPYNVLSRYSDYIVKAKGRGAGLCAIDSRRVPLDTIPKLLKSRVSLQILNLQHYQYFVESDDGQTIQLLKPGSKITSEFTLDGIIPVKNKKKQREILFELPKKLDLSGAAVYLSAYQQYQMFEDLVIQECGNPNFPYVSDVVRKELDYIKRLQENVTHGRYVGDAGIFIASKRELNVALQLIGNVTPYLSVVAYGHLRVVGNYLHQLQGKIHGDLEMYGEKRRMRFRDPLGLSFGELELQGDVVLKNIVLNSDVEADMLLHMKRNGKQIVIDNVYYLQGGEKQLLKI